MSVSSAKFRIYAIFALSSAQKLCKVEIDLCLLLVWPGVAESVFGSVGKVKQSNKVLVLLLC